MYDRRHQPSRLPTLFRGRTGASLMDAATNRFAGTGELEMHAAGWAPDNAPFLKWDTWSKWILFLLLGLSLTGRSFAYLGIPPAKLFVGDLTLAAFIVLCPRKLFDPWIVALTKGGPLGPVAGCCWYRSLTASSN